MKPSEYQRLIHELLDGEISANDFALLDEELRTNPEALAAYRIYTGLHCGLVRKGEIEGAIHQVPVVPVDRIIAMQRRKVAKISLLAAAAAVMISGFLLWLTMAPENPATLARLRSTPGSSFAVSHASPSPPTGNTLHAGSVLRLDHGAVELALPHQVRAVLEAPATLTLINHRTVRLDRGTGLFEVPTAEGHGFTVETPHQRIIDLGTAFGVRLSPSSLQTELHVFEGKVRLSALDRKTKGEIISAPRAISLSGTKVSQDLPVNHRTFRRHLPERVETVLDEDFESGLLADKQYAIHMDPTAVVDARGNRFPGISEGEPWTFSTAPELRIRNAGFEQERVENGMAVPGWQEITGAAKGFNTYVQNPKPTEGTLLLSVGAGLTLIQDLKVPIRNQTTYTLSLDIGNDPTRPNSWAIIGFFGSEAGFAEPLAVLKVDPPAGGWLRRQTLSFEADASHANGQTLGIALASESGSSLFDDLRIFANHSSGPASAPESPVSADRQPTTSPLLVHSLPVPGATSVPLDLIPTLAFDTPIQFGTGRIIIQNQTDGTSEELIVGSNQTSLRGTWLRFLPSLALDDGASLSGGIPGWETNGLVARFNPDGGKGAYLHPGLADHSETRGVIENRKGRVLTTLSSVGHPASIRRLLDTPQPDRTYTISVGIGCRDTADTTPFAGYRIRLLRGSTTVAELADATPPGPANTVQAVGLSWDFRHLPDDLPGDEPLYLEVSTLHPVGSLDIDHVRVTSVAN